MLIAVAIVVASGLGVITPFLTQAVFDNALFVPGGPDLHLLVVLVALMILIPLVSALIGVGQTYLTTVARQPGHGATCASRLFEHLQAMDLGFFTATKTGAIQSRLANDVGGVQTVLTDTASSILSNVVTVIARRSSRCCCCRWQLTLVALALLPVFVVLQVRVGRVRRRLAARTQASLADMTRDHAGDAVGRGHPAGEGLQPAGHRDRALPAGERAPGRPAGAPDDDRPVVLRRRPDLLRRHARRIVYLVAGLCSRRGDADHRRHDRRLHHAADAAALPLMNAAAGLGRRADVAGALRSGSSSTWT